MFGLAKLGVSVIGYPILAVIAMVHGILWFIGWVARHCLGILGFVVSPWTGARVANKKTRNIDGDYYCWSIGLTFVTGFACLLFGRVALYYPSEMPAIVSKYHLDWLTFGLAVTNVFSMLYEIGRAYKRYLTGESKREREAEAGTKQGVAVPTDDNFRALLGDVLDQLDIEPNEESEFEKRLSEIKLNDYVSVSEEMLLRNLMKRKRVEVEPELAPSSEAPPGETE